MKNHCFYPAAINTLTKISGCSYNKIQIVCLQLAKDYLHKAIFKVLSKRGKLDIFFFE